MTLPYVVRPLDSWLGPRTRDPQRSRFASHWNTTLAEISDEIAKLGATSWVLQMDVSEHELRRDGGIRANAMPASYAIRVNFTSATKGPLTFACDTYNRWQDNVRAVMATLRALRAVDRYGVATTGEQYRGWQAISNRPATMTRRQAAEFMAWQAGAEPGELTTWADKIFADMAEMHRAYYKAAKRAHPDITHDDGDTMARLNAARDLLLGSQNGATS
jgi:hypothetical protein